MKGRGGGRPSRRRHWCRLSRNAPGTSVALPAVIVDPFTKIPFPGNVIPADRINPVGAELANLYPAPNNADPARNYIGHPKGVSDNNVLAARIDYQAGSRDAIWGRFTRNAPFDRGVGQALSPAFPGFDQEQSDNNLQLAVGDAHSFTPTTINEVNIGFVQFRRERRSVDAFTRNWIQELGIKGISPDPLTWAAPSMTPERISRDRLFLEQRGVQMGHTIGTNRR